MSKWYYELPYGPLTRENHSKLASALYDATDPEQRRVAERRGIGPREFIGVEIAMLLAKSRESDDFSPEQENMIHEGEEDV